MEVNYNPGCFTVEKDCVFALGSRKFNSVFFVKVQQQ